MLPLILIEVWWFFVSVIIDSHVLIVFCMVCSASSAELFVLSCQELHHSCSYPIISPELSSEGIPDIISHTIGLDSHLFLGQHPFTSAHWLFDFRISTPLRSPWKSWAHLWPEKCWKLAFAPCFNPFFLTTNNPQVSFWALRHPKLNRIMSSGWSPRGPQPPFPWGQGACQAFFRPNTSGGPTGRGVRGGGGVHKLFRPQGTCRICAQKDWFHDSEVATKFTGIF